MQIHHNLHFTGESLVSKYFESSESLRRTVKVRTQTSLPSGPWCALSQRFSKCVAFHCRLGSQAPRSGIWCLFDKVQS